MLSLLPPVGYKEFLETDDKPKEEEKEEDTRENDVFLLDTLLRALRKRAGFRLPHVSHSNVLQAIMCVLIILHSSLLRNLLMMLDTSPIS